MKHNNMLLISIVFILVILACQQLTPTSTTNNESHETQPQSTDVVSSTPVPSSTDIYTPLVSGKKISENPELAKELMRSGKGAPEGDIIYSPDRTLLAVPSTLGINLFNSATLEEVKLIESNSLNYLAAFSPDGKKIVSVLVKDKTINNHDIGTGELICESTLSHEGDWFNPKAVKEIAFTPDGQFIVTKGLAGIYIYDSETCNEIDFINSEATSLWFTISPDGKKIASSTDKGIVSIWEIPTGKLLLTLKLRGEQNAEIINGVFSSDSQQLATGTDLGPFQLWDVATGKMLGNLGDNTHGSSYVRGYFNKDSVLLIQHGQSQFELWDVASKEITGSSFVNLQGTGYGDSWFDCYSKDGKIYITLLQYGKPIIAWEVGVKTDISPLEWSLKNNLGVVPSKVINFDSGIFVRNASNSSLELWDFNSEAYILIETIALQDTADNIALSPDGSKIAVSFKNEDGIIEIWDVKSNKMIYSFKMNGWVGAIAFSPNGEELASTSYRKEMKFWNVATGQLKKSIPLEDDSRFSYGDFIYSPDGTKLAAQNNNWDFDIWDVTTGKVLYTLQAGEWTENLVFSPDGQFLASSERLPKEQIYNTIKLWDVNTGNLVMTLENNSIITTMSFSPDGKQLAVASHSDYPSPATIVLWDLTSGTIKQILNGHTMQINNLAYLSEGTILASSSADGTIRIWGVP